jgi:hypothetical protein
VSEFCGVVDRLRSHEALDRRLDHPVTLVGVLGDHGPDRWR